MQATVLLTTLSKTQDAITLSASFPTPASCHPPTTLAAGTSSVHPAYQTCSQTPPSRLPYTALGASPAPSTWSWAPSEPPAL
ncbi:unnamed protein product [Schistosoma mattheei]|uniref:Uncharacterized protein n=1 Tax=Schistosoma mattheei TaxID=31246 RepID=A0A183Q198_9TREM|nr:unnamed protein product [Schistosoma mattheei]